MAGTVPAANVMASARKGTAINLAADTPGDFRALYIGTTGNVVVDLYEGGTAITFASVPIGFFPVHVTKVYSAANGTTASNIVGLDW